MANSCVFIPSKGADLFRELRKHYDYSTARSIFLRAINPQFIEDFKGTLSLDAEGIPSFESIMNNPFIKNFVGLEGIKKSLESKYSPLDNTRSNYSILLGQALQFNQNAKQREDFVAIVEQQDDKLRIVLKPKNEESLKQAREQFAVNQINTQLSQLFAPLGISAESLSIEEERAGRVGVTNFNAARNIASSFSSIIKVANNMEGEYAISEEFSHLIIGAFRNDPLVARSITSLQNNEEAMRRVLGEHYDETVEFHQGDMSLVAEEALGHILQSNLLKQEDVTPTPAKSLFQRMYNWVIGKFKKYSPSTVDDILDSVDSAMSSMAKDILSGTRKITKQDIINSERDLELNALSDRIDRNIKILQESAKTEIKRYKVSEHNKNARIMSQSLVNEILSYTEENANTVEGLFKYAKNALDTIRSLEIQFSIIDSMDPKQKFGFLRNVRAYTQSYGTFIREMRDAINEENDSDDNMFTSTFVVGEGENAVEISIPDIIKDLSDASDRLTSRFFKVAFPAFAEFLKPFLGEQIVVPFGKYAGTTMAVDDLLREAPTDIGFMDRWMQSMGDSADVILQGFDQAVKKAKDNTREQAIEFINRIHEFRQKAESLGITNFDWAFESDSDGNKSGNYISPVNYAQFKKELQEMLDSLDEKYGKNPTGPQAMAKIQEKNNWLSTHSVQIFGEPQPNPVVYRNSEYDSLTETQKDLLDEFLNLKAQLDNKLPKNRVSRNRAIQMRKSGGERFWESLTSPSSIYENVVESTKSAILDREDDDDIFGDNMTRKGLTDFSGNEFMCLPVLYTNTLKNPNEISTDLIGSLMAYAYTSIQYENMDEIVNQLEVGRILLTDQENGRKVRESRGGKRLIEKFDALDTTVANKIFKDQTNMEAKLKDFLESQVYHKYLKDQGTVGDTNINVNKATSAALKVSSLAQMGFNWLANIANVATGLGMQNIEAAAGQFFSAGELLKADGAYFSNIAQVTAEANSRAKQNKVSLFFDLFDVRQNFEGKTKRAQTKNWMRRIFGENIAFLGQEVGDHWLYGRTAIAMAMREKVLLNGQEMSLWDALQVQSYNNNESIKELNYKDITNLDGTKFDVGKFSRKVAHVNQVCFGIYNDDDANAANRIALGRLLQQYRKWMIIQYSRRFREGHANLATDTWEEGYYRTFGRYLNELRKGGFQIASVYKEMSKEEQHNVKRAVFELAQFFAVWAIANWIDWPDDKNRPWAIKLAEYSSKRLAHEFGGLTPSTVMPQELFKTVKSPFPIATVVGNTFNLINSAIDPADWTNEIQSGPYKGMSTLEKNFIKAPIPGVAQWRQIDKFIGDLDNSINYYARPNS